MKLRLFALILTLSLIAWAQGNPQDQQNSTPAPEAKASCCHHSADMKEGKGCCHHSGAGKSEGMTCCGGDKAGAKSCSNKDMKACMEQCKKDGKDCCANGKCDKDAKSCCGNTASNCCGASCERHRHAS
jgi:hypothetical protein